MQSLKKIKDKIFTINSQNSFNQACLEVFQYQKENNAIYGEFVDLVGKTTPQHYLEIPFLPIDFFKTKKVISGNTPPKLTFESSGTTSKNSSHHYLSDTDIYEKSLLKSFELFYGKPQNYCFLALLPSYLERNNSSLVYMCKLLIEKSRNPKSGFYLNNFKELHQQIIAAQAAHEQIFLIGVSFALLDFSEQFQLNLQNDVIMDTGGMKGRRKEITKEELHLQLKKAFACPQIHSEYGMTELLSQAYSLGENLYRCPPWMKVFTREFNDPFSYIEKHAGGINVIDLANLHSCSFIATDDIGKIRTDGSFEVIGRIDNSAIRGCNLMSL